MLTFSEARIAVLLMVAVLASGCDESSHPHSSPTPTATVTQTATPSATPTPTVPPPPVGLAALTDLDTLPELRPPGTRAEQISSYDRTGGNADLGVGPDTAALLAAVFGTPPMLSDNSYLYQDGDRYVIFDERGPGIVDRIWMTGIDALLQGMLGGDISFQLDDEPEPRLRLTRTELFGGVTAPFLTPLAGNRTASAGGFYSVLPIPFAHRLRITTSNVPNYVHVTFTRLPPERNIESFDPTVDTHPVAAVLAATGTDPKASVPTIQSEIALAVPAHDSQVIWERTGAGAVLRFELLAPAGAEVPLDLRLLATWDGAAARQIDAPLDDFFGASLGPAARSLAFGRDGDRLYNYFSMPFRSSARIVIENDGDAALPDGWVARISITDEAPGPTAAWLYARAASDRLEPDGQDYVLLNTTGTGHVVAVVMTAGCAEMGHCQLPSVPGLDGSHLEGDEHIATDGSRYPQIHGTGFEDFFSGGFYFLGGPVDLPTHGNPAQPMSSMRRPGINLRSAYRLFLGDPVPFANRIHLAIEHGPVDDVPAEMSSLVFYYGSEEVTLFETDRIVIGDPTSEAAHTFVADGRVDQELVSSFRGDDSNAQLGATGLEATRTQFHVRVDPTNRGVRLRRLADIALGRQSADVSVNGMPAGTWFTPDINPILRWADLDFDLPPSLTVGHDELDITLDATASPTPWTAYGYSALSYVP